MSESRIGASAPVSTGAQTPTPRVRFDETRHFAELDLSGQDFVDENAVTSFFRELERRFDETGRDWFILVRDDGFRIEPAAWTDWADASDRLRRKHGLGTARYPDPDGYGAKIQDPTRFESRAAALAALDAMVAQEHAKGYRSRLRKHASSLDPQAQKRLTLDHSLDVAALDLEGMSFASMRDVERFFQSIDTLLGRTLQRWWLLIEAEGCRIAPEALGVFAQRGRSLCDEHGLGAVRVMGRAAEAAHDPLVCVDREAGLAAIRQMRHGARLRSA